MNLKPYVLAVALGLSSFSSAHANTQYCEVPPTIQTQYLKKHESKTGKGVIYLIPSVHHQRYMKRDYETASELIKAHSVDGILLEGSLKGIISHDDAKRRFQDEPFFFGLSESMRKNHIYFAGSEDLEILIKASILHQNNITFSLVDLYDKTSQYLAEVDKKYKTESEKEFRRIFSADVENHRKPMLDELERINKTESLADFSRKSVYPMLYTQREDSAISISDTYYKDGMKRQVWIWGRDHTRNLSERLTERDYTVCVADQQDLLTMRELFWDIFHGKTSLSPKDKGVLTLMAGIANFRADAIKKHENKPIDMFSFIEPYVEPYFKEEKKDQ
mgnify:CR=1 FL=1